VPSRRQQEEQALLMPVPSGRHAGALNQHHSVLERICGCQYAVFHVELIVWDIENSFEAHLRHFSEQYFTFSQFLAHFLRHSNLRPHFSHVRGGKPFLVFGIGVILQEYA
jgi:hypothetical protein